MRARDLNLLETATRSLQEGRLSALRRQFYRATAEDRKFAILIAGLVLDVDQMSPALDVFARDPSVDEEQIALGIVAPDLAVSAAQETVIAHPVGEMVRQPGTALGAVIVCARRSDHGREGVLPMDALGTIRDAETVLDAEAGMAVNLLPRQLVGAN